MLKQGLILREFTILMTVKLRSLLYLVTITN